MPHKPIAPAVISPAPTKAGTAKNDGETRRPSSVPPSAAGSNLHLALQLSGCRQSETTGRPALRQASSPPSRTKASQVSSSFAARRDALAWVRAPLLQ
jgi:hypothetical protein